MTIPNPRSHPQLGHRPFSAARMGVEGQGHSQRVLGVPPHRRCGPCDERHHCAQRNTSPLNSRRPARRRHQHRTPRSRTAKLHRLKEECGRGFGQNDPIGRRKMELGREHRTRSQQDRHPRKGDDAVRRRIDVTDRSPADVLRAAVYAPYRSPPVAQSCTWWTSGFQRSM